MDNIKVTFIKVCATAGASIGECIKDAALMSLQENRNVILVHNEKEYEINHNYIFECIFKANEKNIEEE
jgi:hypothetical protein